MQESVVHWKNSWKGAMFCHGLALAERGVTLVLARRSHFLLRGLSTVLTLVLLLASVAFVQRITPLTSTSGSINLTVHFRRGAVDIATGTSIVPSVVYGDLLIRGQIHSAG